MTDTRRLFIYNGPYDARLPTWLALILSLVVLGAGVCIAVAALLLLTFPELAEVVSRQLTPGITAQVLGVAGLLPGTALALVGAWGTRFASGEMLRAADPAQKGEADPVPPKLAHKHWTRAGISDGQGKLLARFVVETMGMLLFLILVNAGALISRLGGLLFVGLIFDAVWIWAFARTRRKMRGYHILGPAQLLFERFPYAPGESFEARVLVRRNASQVRSAKATLRRVLRESETTDDTSGKRYSQPVFYETCVQSAEFGPGSAPALGGEGLRLRFDIPAGVPGNDFYGRPASHWELILEAEGEGFSYSTAFWLPIYAT